MKTFLLRFTALLLIAVNSGPAGVQRSVAGASARTAACDRGLGPLLVPVVGAGGAEIEYAHLARVVALRCAMRLHGNCRCGHSAGTKAGGRGQAARRRSGHPRRRYG